MIHLLHHFFGTWRFATFLLALVATYELMLAGLLFWPAGDSGLGAFAEEFRVWCFEYDPATGGMEYGYVITTFLSPLVMAAVVLAVWGAPLREILHTRPTAPLPYAGAALAVTLGSAALLTSSGTPPQRGEFPFPAESLRTEFAAPDFELTDHTGGTVALEDLRGKVTVVTAVYATCGFTCPMIMGQLRDVLAELTDAEHQDLRVVGITLDPAHDTPGVLADMAAGQRVEAPLVRLCTGEPGYVEEVLDDYGFSRTRDKETGIIDHANLFLLVDRQGRVAYRLTLGERQQRWLVTALRLLLREEAGAAR